MQMTVVEPSQVWLPPVVDDDDDVVLFVPVKPVLDPDEDPLVPVSEAGSAVETTVAVATAVDRTPAPPSCELATAAEVDIAA